MPWPRFTWDASARQYRDSRGRFVPRADVRAALDATIDRAAADIEAVARRLQRGEVELGAWQAETERLLKLLHVASGAAAVGGWGQATPETWGLVGSRLKDQYRYLRDFAGQLANGLPLDGRFLARAGMYALSGTATHEAILRRGDLAAGYDLEKRVLAPGKKEACPECVGYAALGWQPAGALPDIGQGSRCLSRCRCRFARARSSDRSRKISVGFTKLDTAHGTGRDSIFSGQDGYGSPAKKSRLDLKDLIRRKARLRVAFASGPGLHPGQTGCLDIAGNGDVSPDAAGANSADVRLADSVATGQVYGRRATGIGMQDFPDLGFPQTSAVVMPGSSAIPYRLLTDLFSRRNRRRATQLGQGCRGQVQEQIPVNIQPELLPDDKERLVFGTDFDDPEDECRFSGSGPKGLERAARMDAASQLGSVESPSAVDIRRTADVTSPGRQMDDGIDAGVGRSRHAPILAKLQRYLQARCRCRFARQRSGVRPARLPRVSPITGAIVTAFATPEVDFADAGLVAGPEVEFGDFEPVEIEPEPYRPPWWRRVVGFATKGRLPRKAHGSLNPGCGTGAGGFKPGNTCGKRVGAHGTGRGGTQAQRKALAAKIRALRGLARTPEQKQQLVAAIRTLKAHERGTGDAAAAAKVRRQIHAGKAPKVAAVPRPPAVPKPKVTPTPKPKQPTARERLQAAVAAQRAGRGLSAAARKNKAEGLRRERTRKAEVRAKADRARKVKAAVAARRGQRGLSPEQRQQVATSLKQGRKALTGDLRAELRKSVLEERRRKLGVTRALKPTAADRVRQAVAARRQGRGLLPHERRAQAERLKAARAKPAPAPGSKGYTGPIDPGQPIAERIRSYAAGAGEARRQVVLAATKPHLDRKAEIQAELEDYREIRKVTDLQKEADRLQTEWIQAGLRSKKGKAIEPKLNDVVARLDSLQKHRNGLRAERDAIQEKVRQATAEALKVDDPVRITWKHGDIPHGSNGALSALDATTRAHADEAATWVSKITRKGDGRGSAFAQHLDGYPIGQRPDQRAYCSSGSNDHIALKPGESGDIVVHELGHAIDHNLSIGGTYIQDRVREFLKHRIGSEAPVSLKDKFGGRYEADEFGAKDEFDRAFSEREAHYVGKVYRHASTEIVAMGVQKLYNDPVGFAKADPEYFHFVTGILGGELR